MSLSGVVQAEYEYNALGQQVIRRLTQTGQTIHNVFDMHGQRVAEYDYDDVAGTSTLIREYIWMNGQVIAVVEAGEVYYVRSDHIGRPVFATDILGTVVWEASYLPFGGVHISSGSNINLRFPGQWFQAEAGLHQNWMRDYDPTIGRYIQADPLGLVDGASVYGYALQNPGRYVDPRGEFAWGLAFGAAVLAYELYKHDWHIKCVNWFKVGGAAISGGFVNAWRTGALNFGFKGSTFGGVKNYMKRNGINPKKNYGRDGDHYHHWALEQRQGLGRNVPGRIKNQPWNLNPVSPKFNQWMNKYSKYGASYLGAPMWTKEMAAGMALMLGGSGCGCEE